MKKDNLLIFIITSLLWTSCAPRQYTISEIESNRIAVDSSWDEKLNPEMESLVNSYKQSLENQMNIEIGFAKQTMIKGRPQSLLTNFTADVMRKKAIELWGEADFAVVNNGGIRSTLNEGTILVEDLYEIYSFDNTLVLLDLPGEAVIRFFEAIALEGGQGLSDNLEVVIEKNNLKSLKIGGESVNIDKIYKIATLDYLAEGNDGMVVFKEATNKKESHETLRDIMIEYVKQQTVNNYEIDAKLDNRIIINP
ncbi:5'-nucleotidase C-terminal domain-containing protein [Bacteroidales bacterium OttesenSCG-928-M11]|nr:5'-nucleotidase C-terminal domain-containing protein [Bacteroidales bacterium OttesenSCG-928-M11]